MGLFKEDEIVDYTLLKKKGIIKVPEIPKKNYKITSDEFVDISAIKRVPRENSYTQASTPTTAPNPVSSYNNSASTAANTPSFASFFGDSSSSSTSSESSANSIGVSFYGNDSSTSTNTRPSGAEADLSSLKIKIEDIEYKLERLLERLDKIESNKVN